MDRDEITTWATPIVARPTPASAPQVVVSASKRIRSYDLTTGRVIWDCGGMSRNVIASPVFADGIVCFGCSYDLRAMLAIKLDSGASGDITGSPHVLWSTNQRTPYVPSPLLYDGRLYFLGHYQGRSPAALPRRVNASQAPSVSKASTTCMLPPSVPPVAFTSPTAPATRLCLPTTAHCASWRAIISMINSAPPSPSPASP